VARRLQNRAQRPARGVRRGLTKFLSAMRQAVARTPDALVGKQLRQFVKVTAGYRPGLLTCHRSPDLPRTNNA
jgi:hypothetical protein